MDQKPKRITSEKCTVLDIVSGAFSKGEGMNSSTVKTLGGKNLSRVWVLGTVIETFTSEKGNFGSITIDDGTETIRVKTFNEDIPRFFGELKQGDLVDIIGKIKEYEEEVYIQPEAVQKLDDPNWETLRKLEIYQLKTGKLPAQASSTESSKSQSEEKSKSLLKLESDILEKVGAIEGKTGVPLKTLINEFKDYNENDVLGAIRNLMMHGDLYEPTKDHLKRI